MLPIKDFDWIRKFRSRRPAISTIADLIPRDFEKYIIIPWSVGVIEGFPFHEYPNDTDTIEKLNKRHAIEREFGLFLSEIDEGRYKEMSYQEMSSHFDVGGTDNGVLSIGDNPGISYLFLATSEKISKILNVIGCDERFFLFIEDNFRFSEHLSNWTQQEENSQVSVADYLECLRLSNWDMSSFLFSQAKRWCLCTVEDYPQFLLGCNKYEYSQVMGLNLDVFEVDYSSRF
jgi:hypothetical protein